MNMYTCTVLFLRSLLPFSFLLVSIPLLNTVIKPLSLNNITSIHAHTCIQYSTYLVHVCCSAYRRRR